MRKLIVNISIAPKLDLFKNINNYKKQTLNYISTRKKVDKINEENLS